MLSWLKLTVWNIFTQTNPLCSLDDQNRKELCAEVVKACFSPVSDNMEKDEIIEAMDDPTKCKKLIFTTPLVDYEGTWSRTKRMYTCSGFTVKDEPVAEFYLSAAGLKNAVLMFQAPGDDPEPIEVIRMVTGLSYEEGETKSEDTAENELEEETEKTGTSEDSEKKKLREKKNSKN